MPGHDHGWWDDEAARITRRRRALDLPEPPQAHGHLALALSGNGVRSASFCLGVMQALAEAPAPAAGIPASSGDTCGTRSLLAHVDYLATVGGGGYIAAFFVRLFVPGRLHSGSNPVHAAEAAYRALRGDPPGQPVMAGLRETGGHLTSRGIWASLRAAVVVVRNWVATQCVIGSVLLTALAVLALALHLVIGVWPGVGRNEMALLYEARRAFHQDLLPIWWSEYLWLPLVSALLLAVPPAMAYCLVCPRADDRHRRSQPVRMLIRFALLAVVAGALVLLETLATAMLLWLAVATCLVILLPVPRTVAMYRVRATRALRGAVSLTAALIALGMADTVARTCYLYGSMTAQPWSLAGFAVVAATLAWLVHHRAMQLDTGSGRAATLPRHSLPTPASIIAGATATLLALLLFVSWSWIVLWVRWDGGEPVDWLVFGKAWTTPSLVALAVAALSVSIAVGRFSGLLNLSTLQPLHADRIAHAYLGASNGQRVHADAPDLNAYYDPRVLAPIHLINVTCNGAIGAHQRECGGRSLCVGPGTAVIRPDETTPLPADAYAHFMVDGGAGRLPSPLNGSVADWLAISGAAVSMGPGNAPTLGASLLAGLTNLRPGVWCATGPTYAHRGWFSRLFRTQYCLACELTGRLHRMRGDMQYLSDGGRFDATAVYELLRPERHVELIVLCDCGADACYRFDGVANLTRLARTDLGLEISVDLAAARDPVLGDVFGTPEDFTGDACNKVAVLLNVHTIAQTGAAKGPPVARIVLLKPRLTAAAPANVQRYAAQHPAFPHENSADAFFGEAQWDSYRMLGVALGRRIATGAIAARLFAPAP